MLEPHPWGPRPSAEDWALAKKVNALAQCPEDALDEWEMVVLATAVCEERMARALIEPLRLGEA